MDDQAIINAALAIERRKRAATPVVKPAKGVLPLVNLRSLDNWRAFIHQATPVIVTTLVAVGVVTGNQAALWIPLFFAILDPILSVANTQDKIRRIIYGVVGLTQSGSLITGLVTGLGGQGSHVAVGIGAGLTVLSTFLARFYTPTTTMRPL